MEMLMELIDEFGFPIAVCGALMFYIWKMEERHKAEVDKLSNALNNNTLVVQQLVDKFTTE